METKERKDALDIDADEFISDDLRREAKWLANKGVMVGTESRRNRKRHDVQVFSPYTTDYHRDNALTERVGRMLAVGAAAIDENVILRHKVRVLLSRLERVGYCDAKTSKGADA